MLSPSPLQPADAETRRPRKTWSLHCESVHHVKGLAHRLRPERPAVVLVQSPCGGAAAGLAGQLPSPDKQMHQLLAAESWHLPTLEDADADCPCYRSRHALNAFYLCEPSCITAESTNRAHHIATARTWSIETQHPVRVTSSSSQSPTPSPHTQI